VRWGTLALVGLLTATTFAPLPTLAQESLGPGSVATNAAGETVFVRSTPGWDGATAGEVAPGAQVTVSDYPVTAADGSLWYPVAGGYVPAYALGSSAPAAAPAATDQAAGSTGYVDANGTWVDTSGQAAAAQPQASGYLDANGNWVDTTQQAPTTQTTGYVDANGTWVDTTGQAAPAAATTGYVDQNGNWVDTTGQAAPAAASNGYYDEYGNWVDTSGQNVATDQAAGYYDQYGNWVDPNAVDPAAQQAATAPTAGYYDQYGNWVDTSGQAAGTLVSSDAGGPSNTTSAAAPAPAAAPIGTAYVAGTNGDGAICRTGADWATGEMGVIPEGSAIEVTGGTVGEWQPVNCNGVSGYVHASFISWNPPATAAVAPTTEQTVEASGYQRNRNNRRGNRDNSDNASVSGSGQQIANFASGYLGYPYVYAGAGPSGFDCSGFTMFVVQNTLGMDISHSVPTQYSMGTPVSRNQLQPGDLVFFENTFQPGLSHVGIYIGGGQFIHSENESTGVVVSDLNSDYYSSHYYGAVRLA
jgi:cell wall-associated NlpC family hydrolase